MEKYQEKWQQCQQLIAEKVSPHVFDVWFKDLSFESYDPDRQTVLLAVPSIYVFEYLEEVQVSLLKQVITDAFGPNVRLNYRLRQQPAAPVRESSPMDSHISIPNARERLEKGLDYFIGKDKVQWLPAYDQVAKWLTDNRGRGLLCIGTPGLGKSVICSRIIPYLLGQDNVVCVTAMEMGQRIDELLNARCVIIDNLGREPIHEMVNFKRRTPFYELCDAAESRGILLIISTNLSTNSVKNPLYPHSIQERYGMDVISRLRATTSVVEFVGKDFRI